MRKIAEILRNKYKNKVSFVVVNNVYQVVYE